MKTIKMIVNSNLFLIKLSYMMVASQENFVIEMVRNTFSKIIGKETKGKATKDKLSGFLSSDSKKKHYFLSTVSIKRTFLVIILYD